MEEAVLAKGGNRLRWGELPERLRQRIETAAGAPVRSADSQDSGFSPGLASVLRLADGRAVFAKAVPISRNADAYAMHRREAEVLAALPAEVPAPRLLWSHDDGEWVALLTEAVAGRMPGNPWCEPDLRAFVAAAAMLVDRLTPSPFCAATIQEQYAEMFTGWRTLAGTAGAVDGIDPWAAQRLERLAEVEATWPVAAAGSTLLHCDLRADNVLLTGDGDAVVVDWPSVCTGAGWVDLVCGLPSVAMQGGGDPEQILAGYRPASAAAPEAVTAVLTAITGFFLHRSRQPPPVALPRIRAFQRAQAEAGLAWLRRRLHYR